MSVLRSNDFLWYGSTADVAVLRWPEQGAERERLARLGVPRLLLLENHTAAPDCESCVEDWVRLPIDDDDIRARLHALTERAGHHPPAPTLDAWGQLSYRGKSVFLSPTEHALTELFVPRYRLVVSEDALLSSGWPDGDGSPQTLRVHAHRLRRRVEALGLTVRAIRGHGYMMSDEP